MKKVSLNSLFVFLLLFITSTSSAIAKFFVTDFKIPLIIAGAALLVSGIVTFIFKRSIVINILCFLVNSVSFGLAIRGFYLFFGADVGFIPSLIISALVTVCFFVLGMTIKLFYTTKKALVYIITAAIYILAVAAIAYFAFKTSNIQLYTLGLYLLSVLGFVFAVGLNADDADTFFRGIALSTCSVFVAVIGIVILIVAISGGDADCDCDCCEVDCFDLWFEESGDGRNGKKWRKKNDYDDPNFGY